MIKRLLYALLILTISITVSCTEDEKDMRGSIYGVVTYSKTAEPMRAISVGLYKRPYEGATTWNLLLNTVTYDDGHFEFENLEPEEYRIIIKAEGYSGGYCDVIVEAGRTARADMQVSELETNMTVTTSAIEAPVENVITFKGSYSDREYNYYPSEVGFIYGQTQNIDINDGTIIKAELKISFEAKLDLTQLTNGTWYVRAYAKNKIGYEYGEIRQFEINLVPQVKTLDATNIDESTATLNGLIAYEGKPKYSEKGFVYSSSYLMPTVDDPKDATTKVTVSGNSKEFSANISGLTKNKTYHVRAYAKSNDEVFYGEAISFETNTYKPYVIIDNLAIQRTDLSAGTKWSEADDLCKKSRVGGFSDWRLPTLGELSLMYQNREIIGGFDTKIDTSDYWSSTYNSNGYYYGIYFNDGKQYTYKSTRALRVRAVRTIK